MTTMVDSDNLDEAIKKTKKKYGVGFHKGSSYPIIDRIPFESPSLQISTGGGIPLGRIGRLWGLESGGKSLTALILARNAQNIHIIAEQMVQNSNELVKARGHRLLEKFPEGMSVCWYDVEGSFDPVFAAKLGVDLDRIEVFSDNRIEVVGQVVADTLPHANFHIIDSVSGAVSLDELKANIEDWHRAIKARSWNKVLDHFEAGIDKQENAILFIDQIRVDQRTGANMIPGGKKMRHAASMTIEFTRGRSLYKREDGSWTEEYPQKAHTLSEKPEAEGIEFLAHISKSKVGQPHRRARMRYNVQASKFDIDFELAKCAVFYGIAKKSGSWYQLPSGEKIQGTDTLSEILKEDVEFRQKVWDAIETTVIENP